MVAFNSKQFCINVLAHHLHVYRTTRYIPNPSIDSQPLLLFVEGEVGGNLQCPVIRHGYYYGRLLVESYLSALQVASLFSLDEGGDGLVADFVPHLKAIIDDFVKTLFGINRCTGFVRLSSRRVQRT